MPTKCCDPSTIHAHFVSCINLLTIVFLFFTFPVFSQRPVYTIDVHLDTAAQALTGEETIVYTNLSQVPLDSLAVHLWANAYSDKQSAFAKQLYDLGDFDFHFASKERMGGYESVRFLSDNTELRLHYDRRYHDIAWIILPATLHPSESITIVSKFTIKIPESFSRFGRTGDSYQITQWYPHIAVHDLEGWHTMPYLEQGEFYNDFADYSVTIRLPKRYVLAATGTLEQKQDEGNEMIYRFSASNVIDFAWFANPYFQLQQKKIDYPSGRSVMLNVYIDPAYALHWERALMFSERAMLFYSDWLGEYPYEQMSVVSAPFSRGGYMEYPMIAQISATDDVAFLDNVIAHEIGHTWLYAILASNERDYPWMDEGLNTFFEFKYSKQFHPGYYDAVFPKVVTSPFSMPHDDAVQHHLRFANKLLPPSSRPPGQTSEQYLFTAYLLPAEGLDMMESRLGSERMKNMFRRYYQDNQFTHVAPVDLRVSFEKECHCDLSWFFSGWLREAHHVDYRIKKIDAKKREVVLMNKGTDEIPLQVSSYMNEEKVTDNWLEGFRGEKTFHFDKRFDQVVLYEDAPAVNRYWWKNVTPKRKPIHWNIIPKIGSYTRNQISVTPFYGYNVADGLLPGPVILSDVFPQTHWKWIVAPLYGLDSKEVRGFTEIRHITDIDHSAFDKFLVNVSYSKFGYNLDTHYLFLDSYQRFSPSLGLRIAYDQDHPHLTQWLKYRWVFLHQQYGQGVEPGSNSYDWLDRTYDVHELSYSIQSDYTARPYRLQGNAQAGKGFVRLNVNFNQHFAGRTRERGTWIHGFAGYMPVYKDPDANVSFTLSGTSSTSFNSTDYMFDQWLGGRNKSDGLLSRQIFLKDAAFKTLFADDLSNEWMMAGGIDHALPLSMFHLYTDFAVYPSDVFHETRFTYSGGVSVVLLKEFFEIYVPLWESKNIRDGLNYELRDEWHKRISFQVNFRLLNPLDLIDRYELGY